MWLKASQDSSIHLLSDSNGLIFLFSSSASKEILSCKEKKKVRWVEVRWKNETVVYLYSISEALCLSMCRLLLLQVHINKQWARPQDLLAILNAAKISFVCWKETRLVKINPPARQTENAIKLTLRRRWPAACNSWHGSMKCTFGPRQKILNGVTVVRFIASQKMKWTLNIYDRSAIKRPVGGAAVLGSHISQFFGRQ